MKVKPRPPQTGLIKVGQALESRLRMFSHMDPVYTCLDLILIGGEWRRGTSWHSSATVINQPINNGSLNLPDQREKS